MRIESIDIDGFRGIPELKLEFPGQINVLVGVNGAGKSAVLDCTAIMLSRLIGRIRSTTGTGRFFSESDINNHDRETRNKISIQFRGQTVSWRVTKSRRGYRRRFLSELEDLQLHAGMIRLELEEDEYSVLPLAVYYPVNRAVLDIPLRIRAKFCSRRFPQNQCVMVRCISSSRLDDKDQKFENNQWLKRKSTRNMKLNKILPCTSHPEETSIRPIVRV